MHDPRSFLVRLYDIDASDLDCADIRCSLLSLLPVHEPGALTHVTHHWAFEDGSVFWHLRQRRLEPLPHHNDQEAP